MLALRKILISGLLLLSIGGARAAEVTVYAGRDLNGDRDALALFAKKTGIKVTVVTADPQALFQRLERESVNSPADLLLTGSASLFWRPQQAGLTQPHGVALSETEIPAARRDPAGHWVGIGRRARVLVYRTDKVKPTDLSTYEALADARWKGKLLTRSANQIDSLALLGTLAIALGPEKTEQWAKAVAGNLARQPQGRDRDQLAALANGEGEVALVEDGSLARLARGGPEDQAAAAKLALFLPNQADRGAAPGLSAVALARHAPHRAEGVKLLEFLVGAEAQALLSERNLERPVRTDVPLPAALSALETLKVDPVNPAQLGAMLPDAAKIAERAGWR